MRIIEIDLSLKFNEGKVIPVEFPRTATYKNPIGAPVYQFRPRFDPDAIDEFTLAYIEAAFFSDSEQLQGEGVESIAPMTFKQMVEDCRDFQLNHSDLIQAAGMTDEQAGHDFWLTRNRHGAGFWDRELPKPIADELTKSAHAYGEFSLYLADDHLIYGD